MSRAAPNRSATPEALRPLPITVHRNGALVDVIPEPMEVTGSGG
ncbi:hypothetical protein [Nonomuraea fuscirosea]